MIVGIFVGGQARRLGGRAKGLLAHRDGETILEHLLCEVRAAGGEPWLVGSPPKDRERLPTSDPETTPLPRAEPKIFGPGSGLPWIEDPPGHLGPLGGLEALLHGAADRRAEHVIAFAWDMPELNRAAVMNLASLPPGPDVWAARRSPSAPWEPFAARYRVTTVGPVVDAALREGERSFQGLFRRLSVRDARLPVETLVDV
ncbi:MAG: NTP transferase domain-containing protein, partial [Myxococcales bacterium]|nr:NTP transferase domain-containing protein [Myxococcales bacterium]